MDLLPYPLLESNGRYSNAVPEPIGRWVYRADARRARRSNSTSSITSSGSTGAGASTSCASSASDISSERVVVRFVRRYSADAHRAWAAAGLAPALYAVRPLAGGWLLLEMELLSKEAGWVNLAQLVVAAADAAAAAAAAAHGGGGGGGATAAAAAEGRDGASWAAADGTIPAVAAMQRAVASARAALDRAHAVQSARRGRGPGRAVVFAHGDVRPQNIMVRPQEGGRAGLGAGGGSDESNADAGGGGVGGEEYDVRFLDFEVGGLMRGCGCILQPVGSDVGFRPAVSHYLAYTAAPYLRTLLRPTNAAAPYLHCCAHAYTTPRCVPDRPLAPATCPTPAPCRPTLLHAVCWRGRRRTLPAVPEHGAI